jgi:(E)-4-hydroxy-3-methyl-but-2-enyl pyrophosphate reductase
MVNLIEPYGYCLGVRNSISKVTNDSSSFPYKKIVLLMPLVHNQATNQEIEKTMKAEVYDSSKDPSYYADALFIFPAHGATRRDVLLVKSLKGFMMDCTCPVLLNAKAMMKKDIALGYKVYFFGKSTHQETLSALDSDPAIELIPVETFRSFDFTQVEKYPKVALFPQSTVGMADYEECLALLTPHLKGKFIKGSICHECLSRWTGLKKLKAKAKSTFVVVGDETSSNANEFLKIAKTSFPDCLSFLAETVGQVEKHVGEIDFRQQIYVLSSTSSSPKTVLAIVKRLKKLNLEQRLKHPFRGLKA